MDRKIELNLKTLLIILGVAALAFLVWRIRGVLFIIAVAYLISAALLPLATWIHGKGIYRTLAIFSSYIIVIALIVGILALVIPPLVAESSKFYSRFPEYFNKVTEGLQIDTSVINQNLESFGASIVKVALAVVSNTVEFITIFVISIYISFERRNFKKYLTQAFGEKKGERIHDVMEKIETRLGRWIRGQILLDLMIGVLTYIGLRFLNFPYAVPLAVMAGILETVPNIGPIISSIPAVIIGFSSAPLMGAIVLLLYLLIHQTESHLITPRVMSHIAGLRPLAVIIVLLIGGSLMGTIGVVLAIPAFIVGQTIVEEVGKK